MAASASAIISAYLAGSTPESLPLELFDLTSAIASVLSPPLASINLVSAFVTSSLVGALASAFLGASAFAGSSAFGSSFPGSTGLGVSSVFFGAAF